MRPCTIASACIYGSMLAVSTYRLLDQFAGRRLRPFGLHKLFHILITIVFACLPPFLPACADEQLCHNSIATNKQTQTNKQCALCRGRRWR